MLLKRLYDVLTLLSWGCVIVSATSGTVAMFGTFELIEVRLLVPIVVCTVSGWIYVITWWWREYILYLAHERQKKRHRNRKR